MAEITLCMISYKRYPKLIYSLKHLKSHSGVPLNLSLIVQGEELLSEKQKHSILQLASQYEKYNVKFQKGNQYVSKPRYDSIENARRLFNTKYLLIMDDDMIIKPNTVIKMFDILIADKQLGGVACWCEPYYAQWFLINGNLQNIKCQESESPVPSYVCGSGSLLLRSDVFNTSHFDVNMTIAYEDFDFCLECRKNNWNFVIFADCDYKIINQNKDPEDSEYRKERYNYQVIVDNYIKFKEKWKMTIPQGEKILRELNMSSKME
jgi:GT2 family glycosyltransferase